MPPKNKKGKEFQWTDDECELLLIVAYEYKTAKAGESIDKYSEILDLFVAGLPQNTQSGFPHNKEEGTRPILTSKLENIRLKYRQAVDSGRRSGHGRVVMLYFEKVWGRSPATEQMANGIESGDLDLLPTNDPGEQLQEV